MKFDFCIGNPPYNDEFGGTEENETFASPVYNVILYEDYPEFKSPIGSKGKDRRFETGIFEKNTTVS